LRTGREIYSKRKQLRNFTVPQPDPLPILGDPFQSIRTTEVSVTSESIEETSPDSMDSSRQGPQRPLPAIPMAGHYTVSITSSPPIPQPQTRYSYAEKPGTRPMISVPVSSHMPNSERSSLYPTRRYAAMEANKSAWVYSKVAALFFLAMLITWIPSSANRVYSVVHGGEVSVGLEFASAFVLPLQGFWNAVIYTSTSLPACKQLWAQMGGRKRLSCGELKQMGGFTDLERPRQPIRKHFYDTDSTTQLSSPPDTIASASSP
jgi:hypothetical protein